MTVYLTDQITPHQRPQRKNDMRRPLIGILPLVDIQRESYWMLPGYMRGVEEAGGLPVMLPLTAHRAELEPARPPPAPWPPAPGPGRRCPGGGSC